jgi:hypothetical protein
MSFLPEHDRDFFESKEIAFVEVAEGEAKGVILPGFCIPQGLYAREERGLVPCVIADVLVMVPKGYSDTKLDSFYVNPPLFRADGEEPQNCTGRQSFADKTWQFWSRHQPDGSWRPGVDGFDTFLQLIREALKAK